MAIVMVWLPKPLSGNVGHASLLTDQVSPTRYVSWWPGGNGASLKLPRTTGHAVQMEMDDIVSEGGPPIKIALPFLDDLAIAQWWDRVKINGYAIPYGPTFQTLGNDYNMYNNSCCTVVMSAIRLGANSIDKRQKPIDLNWNFGPFTPFSILDISNRLRFWHRWHSK